MTTEQSAPSWSAGITSLLDQGIIDGYALVTVKGPSLVTGSVLQQALQSQGGEPLTPFAKDILKPFTIAEADTLSFDLSGHHLLVFHQTQTSLYALSTRREVGLAVVQLPFGVLATTFPRSTPPPVAIARIEAATTALHV